MIDLKFFFNISRDIAIATNLVAKLLQNYQPPMHLSLCHSETKDIATSMSALTAQIMPLYSVKIS